MPLRFVLFTSLFLLPFAALAQPAEDCPPNQTFGDTSAASFLEFADEGYVTRIYFARLAAQQKDSAAYQLLLPRFGEDRLSLSELELYLSYDDFWERWELSLPRRRVLGIECARYPDALRRFSRGVPDSLAISQGQLFVEHEGGNRAEGSYFHLRLHIDEIAPMPPQNPQVTGSYLPDSAQEMTGIDFAEATYNPAQRSLAMQYGTLDGYQSISLDGVTPGPGRYEEVNDYFGEYTHRAYVIDTLQPDRLALRVYDFAHLKEQETEQESGFFPEVEITYPLSVGKLIADLRSADLTWQPEVPDLIFGQGQASNPPDRSQESTRAADFDNSQRPEYRPMAPSDLTYFPTKGDEKGPVGIRERMQAIEDDHWQLTLRLAERQASSAPDDPRLEELQGIMAAFKELETLREPDAYDEALAKIKQLNQRYDLGMGQDYPQETSPLREQLVEAVTAKYPKDLIQQVYSGEKEAENGQLDELLPITLTIDGKTGLPLRTQLTLLDTEIELRYADTEVEIMANNAEQGRDSMRFPLPEGCIDLFQFRHQLGQLPLQAGYRSSIPVFALDINQRRSLSSQSGRSESVEMEPRYLRATLSVEATERPEGAQQDWYRIAVRWEGEPELLPFFAANPKVYGGPIEATYWLTKEIPHRLRRVEYGGRRGLEAER